MQGMQPQMAPRVESQVLVKAGIANPAAFAGKGLAPREVFNHRVVALPKAYPDSQLLLERRGVPRQTVESGKFWQLNLYTTDFYGLPDSLFTDPEVNWHRQQIGLKGLIAAAGLWLHDSSATITVLQSDLCQQLYRDSEIKRSCKTKVETHFRYWYFMLMNAVLNFCLDRGVSVLYCPTGGQVIANTRKKIAPDLFLRIYDLPGSRYRCSKLLVGEAEYWEIPLQANADRIARLMPSDAFAVEAAHTPRICLFHDIEENVDTPISAAECQENLRRILQIESNCGLDGTYSVLGNIFKQKRDVILASNARHSLGFHSFDHRFEAGDQLRQCRTMDLRVRGYRPPRSQITAELTEYNLTFLNFEWLASSSGSLGQAACHLQNGIVKIPIHFDDYPLYKGTLGYSEWESKVLHLASRHPVFGLGLHDCYAGFWLEHYPQLLEKLAAIGRFVGADELCNGMLLQASQDSIVGEEYAGMSGVSGQPGTGLRP